MSEKDMLVNHHKYKEPVALGKISNNEKCRMIVQLLQEKQKTQAQLQVASMIIAKIPEKTKKKYTDEVKKEIETAKKKHDESKTDKPKPE